MNGKHRYFHSTKLYQSYSNVLPIALIVCLDLVLAQMPREFPKLKGNILVFVGKFEKKKAVYAKIADALGAKIKQELDKDVDFAVIGSGFGEKQKGQILQHNIKPMSEEQWLNWVEETINRKWLLFCWYMRWKAKRIEKLETLSPQTRKQS